MLENSKIEMLEKLKRKTSSIIDGVITNAQCPMFIKFHKQEDPSFFPGVTRQTSVSATNVARESIQAADGPALSIGIIYISPAISRGEDDDDFVTEVYERIRTSGTNIDETFNSSEPLTATISDIQPLLLTDSEDGEVVRTFCNRKPNTVLAIIDTTGRTKPALRDIRAELHKFGNRKLGAVTYCITRKSLEKLFNDNKSNPNYFPRGILWRLNSMHGGQNFKIEPAQMSLPEGTGLMVVGAHISHPGPDAAQSCPSVASVVSNLDQKLTVFPGSVRLHHNPHTEPVVFELRGLMIERCKAWKDKNKGLVPRVIFYRDGLDIIQKDVIDKVVKHEMEIIASAIKSEFADEEKPHLTYVVANKHHIKSTYGSNKDKILKANQIETSRTDESSRYTYYVMPNNDERNVEEMTSLLTNNYQPDQVAKPAIAVPIHYARKLALRTYDYFRFAVTNKYDNFSGALRQQAKHPAYLLGEYRPSEGSSTDVSNRSNPWPKEMDEKMFYL
ncbi:hypothetical protein N0V83_000538 [Neocucurbitaria cava]|uniref:Piwi domain-containing protein n=1 Tax=Neocucurbitaria cava TaxID=798079 RepID=A0A9W9CS87_9PLEO|nr:hypothetical protein N0V83_000538 [Neocucurbitaria cava]